MMLACLRVHRFHLHFSAQANCKVHVKLSAFIESDIGSILRTQYRLLKTYVSQQHEACLSSSTGKSACKPDGRLRRLSWNELLAVCDCLVAETARRVSWSPDPSMEHQPERHKTVLQVLSAVRLSYSAFYAFQCAFR
jgi:hypothetical protein